MKDKDIESIKTWIKEYGSWIPRLDWFPEEEQIELVMRADKNTAVANARHPGRYNFMDTLSNLTFMESFRKDLPKVSLEG